MLDHPAIKPAEFESRRKATLRGLRGAVGVVFAGDDTDPLHGSFHPHAHFEYLTGIADEPGAAVLFDPTHEDPSMRVVLVLKPLDRELEKWDGYRDEIGAGLLKKTGFTKVIRSYHLPAWLTRAAARSRRVACLHPFSSYTRPVGPDLDIFQKLAARIPGLAIEDRTALLVGQRSIKSRAEQRAIQRAGDAYHAALEAMLEILRPGVNERELEAALRYGYASAGGEGDAFNPIVAGGLNATVAHYKTNDQVCRDGDALLVDFGTVFGGYRCDVTRVFPVGGRFTKRQREVYELVLKSHKAAARALKPGAKWSGIDRLSKDVIRKAGYPDAFGHGLGHHLGLETHDVTPNSAVKPGMVYTIEPGLYLPEESLGVRLEDDYAVTEKGCRNLTAKIPIEVDEIVAWMRRCQRRGAKR
ncbi:MAG: Xaa-Pro peptidase family protein [Planctomycetota bacterium]